ncbi:hypothetical protein BP5796_12578 [Coleophoma crateriformis]|uniref:Uncharacterized protein n=1 Tax=Coleophoma crateriformis TaxID=565419 RepID=A0A3D8Q7W0_9HELO|nr:hypothetical protein BP5796_12578 [Coleophoma crateriformis]
METTPTPVRSPPTQLADHTRANNVPKELPKLHIDIVALPSTPLVLKDQSTSSRPTCLRDIIEYKNYKDRFCIANSSDVILAPVASAAAVGDECKHIESGGTVPCLGRHGILQDPSAPPAYDSAAENRYSDTANRSDTCQRLDGYHKGEASRTTDSKPERKLGEGETEEDILTQPYSPVV